MHYLLSLNWMNKLFTGLLIIFSFQALSQNDEALAVGDSLFALGEYSKAIAQYQKTADHLKTAKSYEAIGNNQKALQHYEIALSEGPGATVTRYRYAKLLYRSSYFLRADSIFASLQKAFPNNPNFHYHRGLIKEKQRDSTAITDFEKALSLDRSHLNSRYRIAKRMVEQRDFKNALVQIEKGLEGNNNSIRFLNLQALASYYTENHHQALAAYKKLVKFGQSHPQLHDHLAVSLTKTNQFEKAIDQYTILINEYDDQNPKWHYQIARVYSRLREYEKAKRHYEIAIVLKDLSTEAEYWGIAQLYAAQKEYKLQMETLNKVIEENPGNEEAHYFRAAAADNYYKDKNTVIPFYENYLEKFGTTGKYREYARQRIKDLKMELHFKN